MGVATILIIILLVLLIFSVPHWPYSRGWGYQPFGVIGVILVILLILALAGTI